MQREVAASKAEQTSTSLRSDSRPTSRTRCGPCTGTRALALSEYTNYLRYCSSLLCNFLVQNLVPRVAVSKRSRIHLSFESYVKQRSLVSTKVDFILHTCYRRYSLGRKHRLGHENCLVHSLDWWRIGRSESASRSRCCSP